MARSIFLKPAGYAAWVIKTRWNQPPNKALLAFSFRRPYLELSHCFSYTPVLYTPEKPDYKRAFRVSTYS